jgi:CheY-like chemotaxis protein
MRILILDDDLRRLATFRRKLIGAAVTCVEYVPDCIREIEDNEPFEFIFLDHDLGGKIYVPSGPGTGYEVAQWLKNHPNKMPGKVILHTCNEHGAICMMEELPEALLLSGVFSIDFNLSDVINIKILCEKYKQHFSNI